MTINYDEEAKRLANGFWKPPLGETIVRCVTELSDKMEISYDGDDGRPEVQEKVDLAIEVDGERHIWRIAVNYSQRSLYGQLVMIAQELGGLLDQRIKVEREGSGRGTSYAVAKGSV